jgi:hypothetical protein
MNNKGVTQFTEVDRSPLTYTEADKVLNTVEARAGDLATASVSIEFSNRLRRLW